MLKFMVNTVIDDKLIVCYIKGTDILWYIMLKLMIRCSNRHHFMPATAMMSMMAVASLGYINTSYSRFILLSITHGSNTWIHVLHDKRFLFIVGPVLWNYVDITDTCYEQIRWYNLDPCCCRHTSKHDGVHHSYWDPTWSGKLWINLWKCVYPTM